MASFIERGWQVGRDFASCNKYMFENKVGCDIHFIFTSEGGSNVDIAAHKYMLVSRSPVFEAMLCGDFIEASANASDCITMTDIEPDVFRELLRFLYCEEVSITADNVLHLMFAAKKYILEGLVRKTREYLEQELNEGNVCMILNHSLFYDEEPLITKCLEYISKDARNLLKSAEIKALTDDALNCIMKCDYIMLDKESDMFQMAMMWGWEQHAKKPDKTVREILGQTLFQVRFASMMTAAEFAKATEDTDVLLDREKVQIFSYLATGCGASKLTEAGFNLNPRKHKNQTHPEHICHRFSSSSSLDGRTWGYTRASKWDSIDFKVDSPIEFWGVCVYGGTKKSEKKHSVLMTIYDSEAHQWLGETKAEIESSYSNKDSMIPVRMPHPVKLKPGILYSVRVCLQGPGTYFGKGGMRVVTEAAVTFEFNFSDESTNGTTVIEGQIPGIIFVKGHNV